ncbi:MAG: nucleotide pyrophosphohydrolase [Saccharospirillaceae bacterium]|nr:nucleotide pyrophosphohydrolase [Saccharospirillaceae bacterium]
MSVSGDFEDIKLKLREFAQERDWDQFHSPKNLVMALTGEVGELNECFQWMSEEQSNNLSDKQLENISQEIADVQLYLIRLADKLNIDIVEQSNKKIKINALKYPIDKAKGSSKKYTEL